MHARTEIANKNHSNDKTQTTMNTDYRYQLESKRLTDHQPRKLTSLHCGKKKKGFVRYVDTRNNFGYVAFRPAAARRNNAASSSSYSTSYSSYS